VARWRAAVTARQDQQRPPQPGSDLIERQHRHPRRRQFDRKRQAFQSAADLDDRR
jgi:hypothetical protein